MINIAIVDDNYYDSNRLKLHIENFMMNNSSNYSLNVYDNGREFFEASHTSSFDVVFMDVYLGENIEESPYNDGIELSKVFSTINENAIIIFVTSSEDDIWRAVETNLCFNYIKKSEITYEKISLNLSNIEKKLFSTDDKIVFMGGKRQIEIKVNQIMYVLSDDKYTSIVMKKDSGRYRVLFSEISKMLENYPQFIECNRGILLNMDYIKSTDNEVFTMINDEIFPIRRRDCSTICGKFYEYQFYLLNK